MAEDLCPLSEVEQRHWRHLEFSIRVFKYQVIGLFWVYYSEVAWGLQGVDNCYSSNLYNSRLCARRARMEVLVTGAYPKASK